MEQAPPCPASSAWGTRRPCHSRALPSKHPLFLLLALQLSPASQPWQAEQEFELAVLLGKQDHHRCQRQLLRVPLRVPQPSQEPLVPMEQAQPCPASSALGTQRPFRSPASPSKHP